MMIRFAIAFLTVLALAAQPTQAPPSPKKKAASKAAVRKDPALQLPAKAEKLSDFEWRYQDPQGRSWIYRQLPWGLTRYPEGSQAGANGILAADRGETLEFARRTPFGFSRWSKKKTDPLDDDEKAALAESKASATETRAQ